MRATAARANPDIFSKIQNVPLIRQQCYIDGEWHDADSGQTIAVTNPATGEVIAHVPKMGKAETWRAIDAAARAFPEWKAKTAKERAAILKKWFNAIMANHEDLAILMTLEQGKPLVESRSEIAYAASFIEWFAEEGKRVYGDTIPAHQRNLRIMVSQEPVGVSAAITPWNFPAAMITRKVAPALAAGCASIVKPASQTPLSALALAELAAQAGMPAGVLNIITGNASDIGDELCANPIVRKLSFTGSTEVGKQLMARCAPTLKKLSLELGGNAPFIVFDDADISEAVQGAIASKYRNSGQTCVCSNRLLVQEGIYDEFVKAFTQAVKALKVGNGLEDDVAQGPLIDAKAVKTVQAMVDDAVAKGGKLLMGGKPHAKGGTFFEPTVITEATADMRFAREEIFGPVAPVFRFKTEADALRMANDTQYGLAAYVYARDAGRIWRVSEGLEYGMIAINTGLLSTEIAPFGGVKESGFGREGSHYGILEYVNTKYWCLKLPEKQSA